ncbi:PleD family two-component system response regulator [Loktanella salsilacus]|uniref:PleD family two-component system response regulator n=1 Tax=Loktanella salsilacus TaxID=195913 RepID=UPI003736F189
MVLGYIFVGIVAGLIGAITAAVMGASFWMVSAVYTLAGSFCAAIFAGLELLHQARGKPGTYIIPAEESDSTRLDGLPIPANLPGPVIRSRDMRTLVVDDDPFILELLTVIGESNNVGEIVTVASGEAALALLSDRHTIFDNLLFDISMPVMNGIELCRAVRELPAYRETPITMLTAMRDVEHMSDAFRAGADDYATKPFDVDQLVERLEAAQQDFTAKGRMTSQKGRSGNLVQKFASSSLALANSVVRGTALPVIDAAAMQNYLTQLPRKDVASVQVFALNINLVAAFHADPAPQRCAAMLQEVAVAVAANLGATQTVMAFTDDGDLLVAALANTLPQAKDLEAAVNTHVTATGFADVAIAAQGQLIAVGTPVALQGTKDQRAALASSRAIRFAENRAMQKQGGSVVAFLRA